MIDCKSVIAIVLGAYLLCRIYNISVLIDKIESQTSAIELAEGEGITDPPGNGEMNQISKDIPSELNEFLSRDGTDNYKPVYTIKHHTHIERPIDMSRAVVITDPPDDHEHPHTFQPIDTRYGNWSIVGRNGFTSPAVIVQDVPVKLRKQLRKMPFIGVRKRYKNNPSAITFITKIQIHRNDTLFFRMHYKATGAVTIKLDDVVLTPAIDKDSLLEAGSRHTRYLAKSLLVRGPAVMYLRVFCQNKTGNPVMFQADGAVTCIEKGNLLTGTTFNDVESFEHVKTLRPPIGDVTRIQASKSEELDLVRPL